MAIKPTDGELAILKVLWERGPSTVRQVFEALQADRDLAYTTALKMLQVMHDKGLVQRDDSERSHVYSARYSEMETQKTLLSDLLERAFGGSSFKLVLQALSTQAATKEELAEIRKLLARHEEASS